jgi:outer membrane beta-barrel protein
MNKNMTFKVMALSLAAAAALPAAAQNTPAPPQGGDQVIVPQVPRREIKQPRYPSNDFSISVFGGVYSVENFGSAGVSGVRLGYHVTEDVFAEATLGRTKISDEAYRVGRPGGILRQPSEKMSYYNVSVGYNLLNGEAFFGRNVAKATQGYVIAGVGSSSFAGQRWQTYNYGFGMRLILADWFAVQADVRDHVFANDLLGTRKTTHNPEVTFGITAFF